MQKTSTYNIPVIKNLELREMLQKQGFEFKELNHAFWKASSPDVNICFYKSGKVVVQGRYIEKMKDFLSQKQFIKFKKSAHKEWMGSDESGKGDYFGPLVAVAVFVNQEIQNKLVKLGVRDSKKIADQKIQELAVKIKKIAIYSIIELKPNKYNELISKTENLNSLLAELHAKAIKEIYQKTNCNFAVVDKFGNDRYLNNALQKEKINIKTEQRVRAEDDSAVAAASILARERFISSLAELSFKYKLNFPKGAFNVLNSAHEFVKLYGKNELIKVAKIHFKTTEQI